MASRTSKKRCFRGSSSQHHSETPVNALSFIYNEHVEDYEKKFARRKLAKQFVLYKMTLNRLHLPEVVELLDFQKIFSFLELDANYNEELVKLFYVGIQGQFDDFTFSYKIDNKVVKVNNNVWREFGMFPVTSDAIRVSDTSPPPGYDFKIALNSMLKKRYPDRVVNSNLFPKSVTTDALLPLDRILQWIVSRIIRPKKGGLSRVDQPEVMLIFAIKNKIRIHWPHYITSRMFALRDSGRGTALSYGSLIQGILNQAHLDFSDIPLTPLQIDQEFTSKTLTLMGHHWDKKFQRYTYVVKGNSVSLQDDDDEDMEEQDEGNQDEEESEAEEEVEADDNEEEEEVPESSYAEVMRQLETMRVQQREDAALYHERIKNLAGMVNIQNQQFTEYRNLQNTRYSTLHNMIESHSNNFNSFTSAFMERFPPNRPYDQQRGDENQED